MSHTANHPPSSVGWRFRLVAAALVLVAVAFAQRPGRLVSDTKFDLVVDPGGMLGRALHMWDPSGGFGQVQNQAYGYLLPMGPFFWLGDILSVPGWVVQRLWWALLLVVAFLGVVKLCGALGLGSQLSRVIAGFAYALSPRILTTLGPISIEAWPSALAPWVLVPLVIGARSGSPQRYAAMSALAVAVVGGVNAAATLAVIPLGAVWLLTRTKGPRRRALIFWWPVFVLIGTSWWLVPLLLLGQYSPPFLDYIETSAVTTIPTTLFDALRGTSHWVPYVDDTWQAGNDLISTSYVVLNSAVLLLFGIVGLMSRGNRHRQFLILSLLVGLVMVTLGHNGAVQGWFAEWERLMLDGPLAPLRNVHKFDPVVRLPLVLGLAHLVGIFDSAASRRRHPSGARLTSSASAGEGDWVTKAGVLLLAVVAVMGAASPALTGRIAPADDFEALPPYWQRTVAWLEANSGPTTALLVPGSSFATYLWGTPEDEPVQALGGVPWAVRNAVPLAPPGTIRMLDAVETQLSTGRPSPALAGYLARAGVGHLVVRNDLRPSTDVPDPVLVHQALDGSLGIRRVTSFGPRVGGPVRLDEKVKRADRASGPKVVVDDGWHAEYRAVEIYEVDGAHPAVAAESAPVVVGGPENLLGLMETGLLGSEPAVLAVDTTEPPGEGGWLLTDGLRRREANFARIHDSKSATLTAGSSGRRGAPAREYSLGDERWETYAKVLGAGSVDASSSRAFADTSGPVRPESLPFAAFDGLVETAWRSGTPESTTQPWIEVTFEERREVRSVTVLPGPEDPEDSQTFQVVTDAGSSPVVLARGDRAVTLQLPTGLTSRVRVVGASTPDPVELAIAEVNVPGLDVDRSLVLPEPPTAWGAPDGVLLSSAAAVDACVRVGQDTRCAQDRARAGEDLGMLDRTLRLPEGASYEVGVAVGPRDGDALQGLIQRNQFLNVSASSAAVADPRASAVAAVDGDPGTTWVADPGDRRPELVLNWIGVREVSGIRLRLDRQTAAAEPRRVQLVYPGGRQTVDLSATGEARVRPFGTQRLVVRVVGQRRAVSAGADEATRALGVGVSELRVDGVGLLPLELSDVPTDIGCGFGPALRVGDRAYQTSVVASPRELFDSEPVPARVCGPALIDVPGKSARVAMGSAPAFRPLSVVMTHPRAAATRGSVPARLTPESPVRRELQLPPGLPDQAVVALRENTNLGWEATSRAGEAADSIIIDGWQQGWRVSGASRTLQLAYAPDTVYRTALQAGAIALMLLTAGALVPRRRRRAYAAPLDPRRLSAWGAGSAGIVALGVVAGWSGVVCGVLGAVVYLLARTRISEGSVAWASVLPLVAAAFVYWLRPLGSEDGWAGAMVLPQLLVALTLGAVVACCLDPGNGTFFQRMLGRSTSR